jgi:threonine-phosphate decarboxylase
MQKISCPRPPSDTLYRHGDRPGPRPADGLDFSVNLNPLGPPETVIEALRRSLGGGPAPPAVARYPDPACRRLAEQLAARHGVAASQVVVGNGSSELLHALPRAFPARRAAVVEPTYTEYLRASLRAGAEVEHWLPDDDAFRPVPFDPAGADLVWLGNPNNPTGWLWPRGRLAEWVGAFPRTLFAVDEAFLPFLPDGHAHSLVPLLNDLPNLVVVRSLTKLHTLPGLRLGYAVTGADRARRLREQLPPWSVNAMAQAAGLAALDDGDFLRATHAWFRETVPAFFDQLRACSPRVRPLPSRASFFLLRLQGVTADELAGRLSQRGVAVRDASNFVGLDRRYVRVAVRRPEENRRLLDELPAACGFA